MAEPTIRRDDDGRLTVEWPKNRRPTYEIHEDVLVMFVEQHNDMLAQIERLRDLAEIQRLRDGIRDAALDALMDHKQLESIEELDQAVRRCAGPHGILSAAERDRTLLLAEVRRLRELLDGVCKAAADALDGGSPDGLVDALDAVYVAALEDTDG